MLHTPIRTSIHLLLILCLFASPGVAFAETGASPDSVNASFDGMPGGSASQDDYDPLFDDDLGFEGLEDLEEVDPFEKTNRTMFKFNRGVDRFFWDPLTATYRFLVPAPLRKGLRRIFVNGRAPVVLVNHALQGRVKDAAETLGSFLLNSTAGVGGLFDAAAAAGWELGEEDFGQTLARAGVSSGPYIVVPVFGPNTVRDGFGSIVDLAFDPLTYLLGPIQGLLISGPDGFTRKDATTDNLEALEESSVDFYAALRSAYLQTRAAQVNDD